MTLSAVTLDAASLGERFIRVFSLGDHNTRVVLLGTTLLGLACGVIGSFMLLRKRSLMGDAVSHATLPGIGIAFLLMTAFGGSGKYLPGLLLGAFLSGLAGMGFVLWVTHASRLKQDAALGIVLSAFFGLGVALLGIIQKSKTGHAAGLESFIYGKTASMLAADAAMIGVVAAVTISACVVLFKEFGLLCFDPEFAGSQGRKPVLLDTIMMGLVVVVTVIGLQAVGLILIIALLVIPAAAARFWTEHLPRMVLTAAAIGAGAGWIGAGLSGLAPRMPAGAVIVLVASSAFLISMLFGPARGIVPRGLARLRLERSVMRQHVLRGIYEWLEEHSPVEPDVGICSTAIPLTAVRSARSWSSREFAAAVRATEREGLVYRTSAGTLALSPEGLAVARQVVRNHRLWEVYLITHADIAPSQVDRDADRIEHVLGHAMVQKLETLLAPRFPHVKVPPTPHPIDHALTSERAGEAARPPAEES